MANRKNSSDYNLGDENDPRRQNDLSPADQINEEENPDTRKVSDNAEEGDEDYDDEELDDEELTEEDFATDEEEEEDNDEVI